MNNKQREIFMDSRYRVIAHGRRHGRTQYLNALKESAERRGESPAQASKANEITLIGVDEAREVSREDLEKIKEHPLLDKVEGMLSTDKNNDWFFREVTAQFIEDTNG